MVPLVIAGASFPCGASDLGEITRRHGFAPVFLDHPHNAPLVEPGLSPIRFEQHLPADAGGGLLLPLLESWVTEGLRLPADSGPLFDRRAASVSRSKLALAAALAEAERPTIPRRAVATVEEALWAAGELGYPVVLRTDTGYSGRGVWVAHSSIELEAAWHGQRAERGGADFAEVRAVMGAAEDAAVVEPWLPGDEWSLDCVIGPSGVHPIRICQKATALVDRRPVTLGYRLTDAPDLWAEFGRAAARWVRALFSPGSVSFACFDVRRRPDGELVPLDFGVRLGSDRIPLLVRRAGGGVNPYAAALDAALAGDPARLRTVPAGLALVHAFARTPGAFAGVRLTRSGEVIDSRPVGFRVEQADGGAARRVATVLARFDTAEEFLAACRDSAEWIHVCLD